MFNIINWSRTSAERYHRFLPEDLRTYLKGRGIPATLIEQQLLGWNESRMRITIPIYGKRGEVLGFRYAKSPFDTSDSPAMLSDRAVRAELYGWDTLARKPRRIVICDGELNRLVLEGHGFPAVSSTAGRETFLAEWVQEFASVKHIYICFARGEAGRAAAKRVQGLLPTARIASLPFGVGPTGDVGDFFVKLEQTKLDFEVVLAGAAPGPDAPADPDDTPPAVRELRPHTKALRHREERVKKHVALHAIVGELADLEARGSRLVANCPFHDDRERAFAVYPATDVYACSVCGSQGDAVKFLMDRESLSFEEALEALERFEFMHEFYGTSS
jgi:DNA primase